MNAEKYEYDVAISFLSQDEPFARQLAEALAPLRVFVYSKAQEQVAGTEGVEAFRVVFRERSRLALVPFRPGWGETPWTRVEATAIRDNCLEHGWDRLFVVRLRRDGRLPKWIPESHIYFDPQTFGLGDLVGAVKARCADLGTELRQPSPAERARAMAQREAFDSETRDLLSRSPQPFHESASALFAVIEQSAINMEQDAGWKVLRGGDSHTYYVFYAHGFTMQLLPQAIWANTARDGYLLARFLRGRMLTPQEVGRFYVFDEPTELGRHELKIHREPALGWCWRWGDAILTHDGAADALLHEFLRIRSRG